MYIHDIYNGIIVPIPTVLFTSPFKFEYLHAARIIINLQWVSRNSYYFVTFGGDGYIAMSPHTNQIWNKSMSAQLQGLSKVSK